MDAGVVHCSTHAHTDTHTQTQPHTLYPFHAFEYAIMPALWAPSAPLPKPWLSGVWAFSCACVHNSCVCALLQNARAYLTWPTPITLALFSLAISTGCECMLDPCLWVTSPPPLIPLHPPLSSPVWLFDSQHHEISQSNCGIFLSKACIVISQKDVNRFA